MNIEQYLEALRRALGGADPALVQDALYDAEEYLRSEVADCTGDETACFEQIVERYGSPEEVAAAYLDTEITVARALKAPQVTIGRSAPGRFFGVVVDPRSYAALIYLLLSLATGIAYFTIVSVLLPLGIGLLPIGVGALVLLGFFGVVRAVSLAEGRFVEALLGERMPRRPRQVAIEGNLGERIKHWFTDWRTWTSILYMVLQMPLGIMYFTVIVVALSLSAAGVAYPIVQMLTEYPLLQWGGYGYILSPWAVPLVIAAGLLGFVLTLHLSKGLGALHAAYAKALLVGRYSDGPVGDQGLHDERGDA